MISTDSKVPNCGQITMAILIANLDDDMVNPVDCREKEHSGGCKILQTKGQSRSQFKGSTETETAWVYSWHHPLLCGRQIILQPAAQSYRPLNTMIYLAKRRLCIADSARLCKLCYQRLMHCVPLQSWHRLGSPETQVHPIPALYCETLGRSLRLSNLLHLLEKRDNRTSHPTLEYEDQVR